MTNLLDQIKDQALTFPPGILRPGQSFESHIGHTVIKLSDINLTKAQTEVLEKGITFCPTPTHLPDLSKIWNDVREFQRKLELKRFFSEINTDESIYSQADIEDPITEKFKSKSKWKPPTMSATIDALITGIKSELLNFKCKKRKKNQTLQKHNIKVSWT